MKNVLHQDQGHVLICVFKTKSQIERNSSHRTVSLDEISFIWSIVVFNYFFYRYLDKVCKDDFICSGEGATAPSDKERAEANLARLPGDDNEDDDGDN